MSKPGFRYRIHLDPIGGIAGDMFVAALAYASAMIATGAKASDWARFVGDIAVMASGHLPHTAAADARTDKCCVYGDADVAHATRRYGYRPEDVVPVGNPDLARFGRDDHNVGSRLVSDEPSAGIMYMDTGLVYTGLVFHSKAQRLRHLIATRDVLARQGLRLFYKSHPDHSRSGLLDGIRAAGVDDCSSENFIARLGECRPAIVEPTSLSIVPALQGMPLFLAQYGPLTGHPRHVGLTEIDRFIELANAERNCVDVTSTRRWIARNAGPLPAGEMPARVVAFVESMAAGKAVQNEPVACAA